MSTHETANLDSNEQRRLPRFKITGILAAVGVLLILVSYGFSYVTPEGPRRFLFAYLHSYTFIWTLSVGALFFVILQHLVRAGWSVVVRRPAELLAANMWMLAIAFVPILVSVLLGRGTLYHWAQPISAAEHATHGHAATGDLDESLNARPSARLAAYGDAAYGDDHHSDEEAAHDDDHEPGIGLHDHGGAYAGHDGAHSKGLDALTLHKRPYLNRPFFTIRWVIYFAVWIWAALFYLRRSSEQDGTGDVNLSNRMQFPSGLLMVLLGLTLTFASFDLLMSLDAHWFSTIFGVYVFSGSVVSFFAVLILILLGLQSAGYLTSSVTVEHYHDLGKFLFAFTFFWGYIAFSQYMLIWYASIPEETIWFLRRGGATDQPNIWSGILLILLFGHFVIPFLGLLSRHVKRKPRALAVWAVWLLVMHWIDLYWVVMPELTVTKLPLGPVEIAGFLGLLALFAAAWLKMAANREMIPVRDPRLHESLSFQNS